MAMKEYWNRRKTAEYLEISRLTLDNMLRDGRVKPQATLEDAPLFSPEYLARLKPLLHVHNKGPRVHKAGQLADAIWATGEQVA